MTDTSPDALRKMAERLETEHLAIGEWVRKFNNLGLMAMIWGPGFSENGIRSPSDGNQSPQRRMHEMKRIDRLAIRHVLIALAGLALWGIWASLFG